MENLTPESSPISHQRLANIYADRIDPEMRIDVLKFVLKDVNRILKRDLIKELNQKANGENNLSPILDFGCGRMGLGKALREMGLDEKIKLIGVDINDYKQKLIPPYSEIILGDVTSEEILNHLREKFGNGKIPAIFGIGLPPEIVKELLEKKGDELITLLDEGGIILFIVDYNPRPTLKNSEFKLFKGSYPSDEIIFYYQKTASKKEG